MVISMEGVDYFRFLDSKRSFTFYFDSFGGVNERDKDIVFYRTMVFFCCFFSYKIGYFTTSIRKQLDYSK